MATYVVYLEGAGFVKSFRFMRSYFSEKLDQAMQFSREAAEAVAVDISRDYRTTAVVFMAPSVSGRVGFVSAAYLLYEESHGFLSMSKGSSYSVFDAEIFGIPSSEACSNRRIGRLGRLKLCHELDLVESYREGFFSSRRWRVI